jgi:hypothetical protein
MKKLSILLISFLSVACASNGYNPSYYFNKLQVVNLTDSTITDLNLKIGGSDLSLSCAEVAKNTVCYEYFGSRKYPQQVDVLRWMDGSGTQRSQQLSLEIAAYFNTRKALQLVIEILEDGSVKTIFRQDGRFY